MPADGSPDTLADMLIESLARSVAVALLALAAGWPVWRSLARVGSWTRWALLALPWLMPGLLVSYAYQPVTLALIREPVALELLYMGVLWLKLTPVAVLALWLAPPPLTAEAVHCQRLLGRGWWERAIFLLRGSGRGPWLALALVFLFAFGEFELASLWAIKTWTVSLFDAHAGGLALGESLRRVAWPFAIQAAVLGSACVSHAGFRVSRKRSSERLPQTLSARLSSACAANAYLTAAALLVSIIPFAIVAFHAIPGLPALLRHPGLLGEIATGAAFATAAAACALSLRKLTPLVLPGLLGALTLSLLILALFQFPILRSAYDSPLPLLLALTLLALPFACVLGLLLASPSPALHLARFIRDRELIWTLDTRQRFLAGFLLFCVAYFDLTASSLLAPVGLTPPFVRLHNLMHYGRTAVLSAMALAAFVAPVALLLLTLAARRLHTNRRAA